ncbi:hypothetical protein [Pseudomonas farsensis]|uniref:DUF3077 domain-containing protein n=2 Tax=Pseudomonas farsensis TaxID=2745492 RepID=A0ABU8QZK5_9PSED
MTEQAANPPAAKTSRNFFTINHDMSGEDALVHAIELIRGIEDTIDEYCCAMAGEPGVGMLVNAAHNAQMSRALAEHALKRAVPD